MYSDSQSIAFPIRPTLVAKGVKEHTPCYPKVTISKSPCSMD